MTVPRLLAMDLMMAFSERTGIALPEAGRRHLWTDAFAVCNLLALESAEAESAYGRLARHLIDQVHHTLGRFRDDDTRCGWISGLSEGEGKKHPTRGGLRIGAAEPERKVGAPSNAGIEWRRDGQYFHFATKWAHALDQVARRTSEPKFHAWARDLMHTVHRAFTYGTRGRRQMVWKLSTDLSRPLVGSMGQLDPLDGFVTCASLEATAMEFGFHEAGSLLMAMDDFADMIRPEELATPEPFGLGRLLFDICRLVQIGPIDHDLLVALFVAALTGLEEYFLSSDLEGPADGRVAYRELVLAIGLAGIAKVAAHPAAARLDGRGRRCLEHLVRFAPLRGAIEAFWMVPSHRENALWAEHEDLNEVMLATCMLPEALLGFEESRRPRLKAA